jgi:hypothetical protein
MKRKIILLSLSAAFILAFQNILFSQQSGLMITPPPIPWYEFAEGDSDAKFDAQFFYAKGSTGSSDPEFSGDVKMYGLLGGGTYRYAFRDIAAFDIGLSGGGMRGTFGDFATSTFYFATIPANLELQPVNTEDVSFILFGGFSYSRSSLNINIDSSQVSGSVLILSEMKGPQFGAQLAFKTESFTISPFFMMSRQSGSADMYVRTDKLDGDYSASTPTVTSKIYGVDIVHRSSGISLSSLIQSASQSGSSGYRIYTISFGFCPR